MQRLATQQRLGLMRCLLSKALRLSSKSKSSFGVGAIVSHLQLDCRVVSQGVVFVNKLWDLPLQLFIALYLLYEQLGYHPKGTHLSIPHDKKNHCCYLSALHPIITGC
jgi:ATP-binding cassette subfamily C (CFTR/MRP) protein 1